MSYLYILDEFLQEKRYAREWMKIETRLTDLGIAGPVFRLGLWRDWTETIRKEARGGVNTVVAVGNDATVNRVLAAVCEVGLTLGSIPLGEPTRNAEIFGWPTGTAAAEMLAARNLKTIDLGQVNDRYFIRGLRVEDLMSEIVCDGAYKITPQRPGSLWVRNLEQEGDGRLTDPGDGRLAVGLSIKRSDWWPWRKRTKVESSVLIKQASFLTNEPIVAWIDGLALTGVKFEIKVWPQKLKVITGRNRQFS